MNSTALRHSGSRVARALIRRWSERISVHDAGWTALDAELDLWRNKPARFWWRDDDAIADTPALQQLLQVHNDYRIPLGLAVIPAMADASLAPALRGRSGVHVLAHGWNHQDHRRPGMPNGELTSGRDAEQVRHQLAAGRTILEGMFNYQFMPVLVPPHNYLAPNLVRSVLAAKFAFVSIDADFAGFPMPSRNVHIDVIDWQRNQAATSAQIVRSAVAALKLRRLGLIRADTPIGLITHHLQHDAPIWALTTALLDRLRNHPGAAFPEMQHIFR